MLLHFDYLRLRAESLYALIAQPIELELVVTDDSALLTGSGFREAVAAVFRTLIPDWRAVIRLQDEAMPLAPGTYSLLFQDQLLFAWRECDSCPIADGPVTLEVWACPLAGNSLEEEAG
jgi:hypothetical protein